MGSEGGGGGWEKSSMEVLGTNYILVADYGKSQLNSLSYFYSARWVNLLPFFWFARDLWLSRINTMWGRELKEVLFEF